MRKPLLLVVSLALALFMPSPAIAQEAGMSDVMHEILQGVGCKMLSHMDDEWQILSHLPETRTVLIPNKLWEDLAPDLEDPEDTLNLQWGITQSLARCHDMEDGYLKIQVYPRPEGARGTGWD